MEELDDIRDDEIRFIGVEEIEPMRPIKPSFLQKYGKRMLVGTILGSVFTGIAYIIAYSILLSTTNNQSSTIQEYSQAIAIEIGQDHETNPVRSNPTKPLGRCVEASQPGFCEIQDTIINDIPLKLYLPHNSEMSLQIGKLDKNDTTIIYAAQAADIRADNGGIVGAFVLKGTPKAWGLSKKGYCASINGKVSVGVADNSPLFEMATEKEGYFFRQYPLVKDGKFVLSELKGKSIRRGICDRGGEIFMVETLTKESFHDFSQALADLGADQAVYLVGSSAYGWAVDEKGVRHEFGNDSYYTGKKKMPKNTNYMIWRKK